MVSKVVIEFAAAVLLTAAVIGIILGIVYSQDEDPVPESPDLVIVGDIDEGFVIAEIPNVGRLRGFVTNESTAIFYGIPFSQTTAGDYRWKMPRDPLPVEDDTITVDAYEKPKACPQICNYPSAEYSCPPNDEVSEDCLTLNIFIPSRFTSAVESHRVFTKPEEEMAVMVYIYGGAYVTGGNAIPLYDARYLAEWGDIIAVTINYRVGPFGFLYQDNGDNDTAALGNYGIYDQIKALEWIQKHIADFGGDPDQVTIFGQSAGAQSIAVLLLADEADSLFHRAIMESNPFGLPYKNTETAQNLGNRFAHALGCVENDLICLRERSMKRVIEVYHNWPYVLQVDPYHITEVFEPFSPVLDNILLSDDPMFLFNEGMNQNKSMIAGYVKDEGALFVEAVFPNPVTRSKAYDATMRLIFKNNSDTITENYPSQCKIRPGLHKDCDERLTMNDVATDYLFFCPGRKALNSTSNRDNPDTNIWFYSFNQTWSFPQFWENFTLCWDKVCHTSELPYLFDMDNLTDYRFTDEEQRLAERLRAYWVNFAKYGNPNGLENQTETEESSGSEAQQTNDLIYWPKFFEPDPVDPSVSYRLIQLTASGDHELSDFKKENCDILDEMDYYLAN